MSDIIELNRGIRCDACGVINWPTAMACMRCNAMLDKRAAHRMIPCASIENMTFSQSLARVFEIVDYVLLAPAFCGLMLSLMVVGTAPWFTLIIAGWFTLGCLLLRGFFRHSRGRLSSDQVTLLWLATIGYNMIDLFVTWTIASYSYNSTFYYLGLWPLLVVIFSGMALMSERRRNQQSSY